MSYRTVAKIDGMMCGMCEAHIQDTIREAIPGATKVKADRKAKEATFLTDQPFEEKVLRRAINKTGYTYVSSETVPYEEKKKGFHLFGSH